MNLSVELPRKKAHPIIAVALSVLLVFLPGCAARMAQQEIDTLKENALAMQKAAEFIRLDRLERNPKCQGAHATFAKLLRPLLETEYRNSGPRLPDSELQPTLDYIRHAYRVQKYMDEKKVTAEDALTVMGDLVLPPALAPQIDPFNGCIVFLGNPPDKPFTQGGKTADDFVFYWQSKDWREEVQAVVKIWDKFLPHEKRTPFDHFKLDYVLTLFNSLTERFEKGEITLLQSIKAKNAGGEYLFEQAKQYGAQLRENLVRAKAQDEALLAAVAVGLGVVATAALVVASIDANYRIANAQTAMANTMQLQALQAQAPIRCNYTLPDRYGSPGYINCR